MLDAPDAEEHITLQLSGEITIALRDASVRLTSAILRRDGDHGADDAPFHLTLAGPFRELRKLRAANHGIAEMLANADDATGDQAGELTLVAPPDLRAELARAERALGDVSTMEGLMDSDAWLGVAFAVDRYDAESVSVLTLEQRTTERF